MRNPGGVSIITNPVPARFNLDGLWCQPGEAREGTIEIDSFTCFHCGSIRHVRPKQKPEDIGGLCKQCMKLICGRCVDKGNCTPLEKKLEAAEARDRALRSYGM